MSLNRSNVRNFRRYRAQQITNDRETEVETHGQRSQNKL